MFTTSEMFNNGTRQVAPAGYSITDREMRMSICYKNKDEIFAIKKLQE